MSKNKNEINDSPSNKKNIDKNIENNEETYVFDVKEKLLKDEEFSPGVKEVFNEVFDEIIEDKNERYNKNKSELISGSNKEELEKLYQHKLKELEEKIASYNTRYQKLEETIKKYEDNNKNLVEKRIEYEDAINEFKQKSKSIDQNKEDLKDRNEKLQEAREHFLKLTRQVEEKKNDLEKKDKELKKLQWLLEKNKYDLDKEKLEIEREKLEFEILRSNLDIKAKESNLLNNGESRTDGEILIEKNKKLKGKAEFLRDILEDLTNDGIFQASFLIDDKGMIISEHSNKTHDIMAIGAMFSLICTSVLRTVNSLNLQELGYFKLSSHNGEFMAKNISLSNYERNLILLAYYDKNFFADSKIGQKLSKKTIKRIMKSIREDFYEFGNGKEVSWIFDNLSNRINFIKQKYILAGKDIEQKRLDSLNKTSISIKEIFES